MSGYAANGNVTSASGGKYTSIAYTSFNLPDASTGVFGASGTTRSAWTYDENHARLKEVRTITSGVMAGTRTTWYLHPDNAGALGFEHEINAPSAPSAQNPTATHNRHYLSAGGLAVGVLVSSGALPTLSASATAPPVISSITLVKVEYWHRDHLGSLAATTDHAGAITARFAFDPFGQRRYANGAYDVNGVLVSDYSAATNNGSDRGFTGHEQFDELGFVHMNGRLYDARTGRFMQADPIIQDALDLQATNRYSYVRNNPLAAVDPSGYFSLRGPHDATRHFLRQPSLNSLHKLIHAEYGMQVGDDWIRRYPIVGQIGTVAVTAVAYYFCGPCSVWAAGLMASSTSYAQGASTSEYWRAGLVTTATAAAFYGVGTATTEWFGGTSSYAGYAVNVAGHAAVGCASAEAGGGDCGPGALSAAFGAAFAPATGGLTFEARVVMSAVIGGTASVIGGGKFGNGAVTAAFGYLFNHGLHGDEVSQSGGSGPNERHALGVEQAIADDLARGFVLVGRNVYVEINGELRVYDYVIRDVPMGINIGVEVKTTIGDTVRLSTRQVNLDTDLIRFGGVIVGTVATGAPVNGVGYRAYCFFCNVVDMRSFRLSQQLEFYGIETQRGKLPGVYIPPQR